MNAVRNNIDPEILKTLLASRKAAYAPYSGFQVAAVAVSSHGSTFAGCNVEVAHFKSICAEASAISAMIGSGQRELATVYILGPGEAACPPCGDCRQRIHEFASADTRVVLVDDGGCELQRFTVAELLPHAFGPDNVGKPATDLTAD